MRHTFTQYGPDGKPNGQVVCNDKEAVALYSWCYKMRSQGYLGPFLLEEMLKKIKRERLWERKEEIV